MPHDGRDRRVADDWVARLARLQPWYLLIRFPQQLTRSVFTSVSAAISIGIIATAAICTAQPLIFPSLGPSAFLFFAQPTSPASSPRNAILAHGSGILIGWGSYWLLGMLFGFGTPAAQVAAAALSLGLISALMLAADFPHPPAASTTLIVSLGLMVHWQELVAIMVGVVMLTAKCYVINRLSGIVYPLWRARPGRQGGDMVVAALQTESSGSNVDTYTEIADRLAARQKLPKSPLDFEALR
jgi:CBS domain-containing membrane protein